MCLPKDINKKGIKALDGHVFICFLHNIQWQRHQKYLADCTTRFSTPFLGFRNVGSRWAMDQAKYNLINEYFLVGVTEELEDFIMLLEAALPRFFRGATELYRTGI